MGSPTNNLYQATHSEVSSMPGMEWSITLSPDLRAHIDVSKKRATITRAFSKLFHRSKKREHPPETLYMRRDQATHDALTVSGPPSSEAAKLTTTASLVDTQNTASAHAQPNPKGEGQPVESSVASGHNTESADHSAAAESAETPSTPLSQGPDERGTDRAVTVPNGVASLHKEVKTLRAELAVERQEMKEVAAQVRAHLSASTKVQEERDLVLLGVAALKNERAELRHGVAKLTKSNDELAKERDGEVVQRDQVRGALKTKGDQLQKALEENAKLREALRRVLADVAKSAEMWKREREEHRTTKGRLMEKKCDLFDAKRKIQRLEAEYQRAHWSEQQMRAEYNHDMTILLEGQRELDYKWQETQLLLERERQAVNEIVAFWNQLMDDLEPFARNEQFFVAAQKARGWAKRHVAAQRERHRARLASLEAAGRARIRQFEARLREECQGRADDQEAHVEALKEQAQAAGRPDGAPETFPDPPSASYAMLVDTLGEEPNHSSASYALPEDTLGDEPSHSSASNALPEDTLETEPAPQRPSPASYALPEDTLGEASPQSEGESRKRPLEESGHDDEPETKRRR